MWMQTQHVCLSDALPSDEHVHTVAHSHTQSHTVAHSHTQSHSLSRPNLPHSAGEPQERFDPKVITPPKKDIVQ